MWITFQFVQNFNFEAVPVSLIFLDFRSMFEDLYPCRSSRKEMAEHSLQCWNGTENEASEWKCRDFKQANVLEDVSRETVMIFHGFQQSSLSHLFPSQADTETVISCISAEEGEYNCKTDRAANITDINDQP